MMAAVIDRIKSSEVGNVPCRYCGELPETRKCRRCRELESRIRDDLALAEKIVTMVKIERSMDVPMD
jgi:recombinational DNA repair protein RecR